MKRAVGQTGICEVVGVVGNVRENILGGNAEPHVYIPFGQQYQGDMQIHLKVAARRTGSGEANFETIRREIRATDEQLPLLSLKHDARDIWNPAWRSGWSAPAPIFWRSSAAVALFLAVIGLYAVNAYTVARRTREIGIRMALGSDASSTLRMILREGLRVTAIGVGIGLLLAIGIGSLLAGFLYGGPRHRSGGNCGASVVLASVALFACYLPARRASRVDPMIALRYD